MRRLAIALLLLEASAWRAAAADIQAFPSDDPGISVIAIEGEMMEDDGATFAKLAATMHNRVVVEFNSPGGSVIAGLQIGRLIQLKHYITVVPHGMTCASACAITWLAGAPRVMQQGARIGFHSAFFENTGEVTGVGNALIGAFLDRLGLSFEAIVFVEKAPPKSITWLTERDAGEIGLEVKFVSWNGDPPHPASTPSVDGSPNVRQPAPPERRAASALPFVPPRVAPGDSPARSSGLDDGTRRLVADYFSHWSEANVEAIDYFADIYGLRVLYYNGPEDHADIIEQKRSFTARWPVRVYAERPASVRTFCNPATTTCVVTGIVDWDCRNPASGTRSEGNANFGFTVAWTNGQPRIVGEFGSVISRRAD